MSKTTLMGNPTTPDCPDQFVMPLCATKTLSKLVVLMGDIADSEPSWSFIQTVNVEIQVVEEKNLSVIFIRVPEMLMTYDMESYNNCQKTLQDLNIYSKVLQDLLFTMQYVLFTGKNITTRLMRHYNTLNRKTQKLLTMQLPF